MERFLRSDGRDGDPLPPELEELLALTAHELHEPLRKIASYGEMLRAHAGASLDAESLDYVTRMERAAERMRATLNCVLSFARVPRGLPFVTIDLGEAATSAVEKLKDAIDAARADVRVTHPLPATSGDPFQMQQLFEQLLDNAIKFRREGVPLVVRVEPIALPTGERAVRVVDNGVGFDDQYAERIFRPFERLHGRGKYPGAGLGLAICRKIAERHGGTLTARGAPGEGAELTLTLPPARERPRPEIPEEGP
ncbi:MAG: ATP-binding protein [Polyangiaceae bacterium]